MKIICYGICTDKCMAYEDGKCRINAQKADVYKPLFKVIDEAKDCDYCKFDEPGGGEICETCSRNYSDCYARREDLLAKSPRKSRENHEKPLTCFKRAVYDSCEFVEECKGNFCLKAFKELSEKRKQREEFCEYAGERCSQCEFDEECDFK